jgi:hypothetical protein
MRADAVRHRTLRYSFFVAGLLVAAVSFLVNFGNALAGEGARDEVTRATFLGVVVGSAVAGGAVPVGAAMARRLVLLAAVIVGGLAGALAGWLLYSLFVGTSGLFQGMLALCLAPVGMWLGWLGGASGNRVVVGVALGGGVGAMLAALAIPMLLNMQGPNNDFWELFGLLISGFLGSVMGAIIGRPRSGEGKLGERWPCRAVVAAAPPSSRTGS